MLSPRTPRTALRWWWPALAVLATDLITKQWALAGLRMHEPLVLTSYFNLTLTRNTGAAFSFLSGAGGWQRWLLAALAAVVSLLIVAWLRRLGPEDRTTALALSLILGGALGNLWDRLFSGAVIDFLVVHYEEWYWPAFNVADAAISVGAVLLVLLTLRDGGPTR